MVDFLGASLTDEQIQTIARESTFNALKEGAKDSHGQMGNVFFRKGGSTRVPGLSRRCQSQVLTGVMHVPHSGEVGDWRNHFSPAQSEEMDAMFNKHLRGTKLGARLKYDVYCK